MGTRLDVADGTGPGLDGRGRLFEKCELFDWIVELFQSERKISFWTQIEKEPRSE